MSRWSWTVAPAVAALVAALGCAGEGMTYADIEPTLAGSCVMCHDSDGISQLLIDVNKLPDELFSAENFPDGQFPAGLVELSVSDLRTAGEPPEDATMDPNMPLRKAWVLHELHELASLLAEATPPDFTAQAAFEAFSELGEAGAWEGCEIIEKLSLGKEVEPEGMPPLWAPTLMALLGRDFERINLGGREQLTDYVDRLLPGGKAACVAGGEGS